MKIVILGYSGIIGSDILNYLAKNTSLNLICVGREIRKKPIKNSKIKYLKWDFKTFKKSNLFFLKKTNIIINCVGKTDNSSRSVEKINLIFIKKLTEYLSINSFKLRLIHLSTIAVYGGIKNYFGSNKILSEKSNTQANDKYSISKLKADVIIQNAIKKKFNKDFSYTILRISNVFGGKESSNLFKFILLTLKFRIWIKSYDNITFNFVNVKDVTQAIMLIISKPKISKNKIYILSDDCKQREFYENYQKEKKKKIFKAYIPLSLLNFIIYFLPLPKKLNNLIYLISSRVSYSNKKIKKELDFRPKFSIQKNINFIDE